MPEQMTFEDAKMIMAEIGITRARLCQVIGISEAGFYRWNYRGVSLMGENFLRVLRAFPEAQYVICPPPELKSRVGLGS